MILGLGLLLAALALAFYNLQENKTAQKASQDALAELESIVSITRAETPNTEPLVLPDAVEETRPAKELRSIWYNDSEYVGYLEIPSLNRKLPVVKLEYVEQLQEAPGLQKGNPFAGDAVICAHNYESHFGPLRDFQGGEEIRFIDMDGETIDYTVDTVTTISPNEVEFVMQNKHPLVLYTCTDGGNNRVVITLNRKTEVEK